MHKNICFVFQDVFVCDTKDEVFVWVGGEASTEEKRNCMRYAHVSNNHALSLSV